MITTPKNLQDKTQEWRHYLDYSQVRLSLSYSAATENDFFIDIEMLNILSFHLSIICCLHNVYVKLSTRPFNPSLLRAIIYGLSQVCRAHSVDTTSHDHLDVDIIVNAVLAALTAHTGVLNATEPSTSQRNHHQGQDENNLRSSPIRNNTGIDSHHTKLQLLRHTVCLSQVTRDQIRCQTNLTVIRAANNFVLG